LDLGSHIHVQSELPDVSRTPLSNL